MRANRRHRGWAGIHSNTQLFNNSKSYSVSIEEVVEEHYSRLADIRAHLFRATAAFFFATALFAQTAAITGRVTDAAGAIVPGADVSIHSTDTGVSNAGRTNDEGTYSITNLVPGHYEVTISKAGFAPIRENGLILEVQQVARVDAKLLLGAVSGSVDVNVNGVLLDSETSSLGQVIESRQITELPLLGRNPYALAMLVPGVRPAIGVNNLPVDQISTVAFAINGQRAANNEFLLDGAPNSAPAQNQPVINATPDLVQEFKVETNNFSAEYGRAAGGVFNVITRSGTNAFHGNLYEFFRNTQLNANDFFANTAGNPRAPFKYNQFGGTIGGPVYIPKIYDGRNKTFFFVSEETVRFIQGLTFIGTLPNATLLSGDFSNYRNAAGQLITIYDPATTVNTGGTLTRTAFPGNIVPSSRINPVALAISKYFPAPNQPGAAFTGINNYVRNDSNLINKESVSYRVDEYFSASNRFFARYSVDDTPFVRAGAYGASNPGSPSAGPQTFGRRNSVVEDSHTISPTWLATVRYSFTRLSNQRPPFSDGFDITSLGLPASLAGQLFPHAFPEITITGYGSPSSSIANIVTGGVLGATDYIRANNSVSALAGTTSKTLVKHQLKAGAEFRVIQLNTLQTGANSPVFSFAPTYTQGPNATATSSTAGSALATFLLGIPGGSASPAPSLAMTTKYYALFVQDSYKLSSRLTLNAGLRWEYSTPKTDRYNQFTNFDPSIVPPISAAGLNLQGALSFVGLNGVSRYQSNPDRNNFAPRLGLAWRVDDKTVLRGGGGIFFADNWGTGTGSTSFGSVGFFTTTNIVTSLDGATPIVSLSNPFPNGLVQPTGSKMGPATLLGQAIDFYARDNATPYAGSWHFSIQRDLGLNMMLEVGYTGSRGLKMPINVQLNQLPDADLALAGSLRTLVKNPFYPQIASGALSSPTVAQAQLLLPYPQFGQVTSDQANLANSTYHALEAKIEKHYSRGLTALGSYTWSKSIDLGIGSFSGDGSSAGVIQNFNNLRGEYAPSALDQTHRFVGNLVYELPFLKAQKGLAGRVLGGWETGLILSMYSGSPLGFSESTSTTFAQGGNQRPNSTGKSAALSDPTPQRWFDTSQFMVPAQYTFGNVARTLGDVRSDGLKELDFTLNKTAVIHERLKLQFRAECFNLTNHPQFAPPSTAQGSAAFGIVSSQNNQPRIVQLALKLLF